jgi:hypothetical protein
MQRVHGIKRGTAEKRKRGVKRKTDDAKKRLPEK